MESRTNKFTVIVYPKDGEKYHAGCCLELDVWSQGGTILDTVDMVKDACEITIDVGIDNNNIENVFNVSPIKHWRDAIEADRDCRLFDIEIDIFSMIISKNA